MEIKKFNISKPTKYMRDGVEKTRWNTVGEYTEFHNAEGTVSRIVEIPAIGLEAKVFPIDREGAAARPAVRDEFSQPEPPSELPAIKYPDEEIDPSEIPF